VVVGWGLLEQMWWWGKVYWSRCGGGVGPTGTDVVLGGVRWSRCGGVVGSIGIAVVGWGLLE